MTETVAIAISGGVDSLVAAHLIGRQTNERFGLHFLTGYETDAAATVARIDALCRRLNLPLHTIDVSASFASTVVDYFAQAYESGQTPNPCLVCNAAIKFGVLMEAARQLGATRLATGHYARVQAGSSGRFRLRTGVDPVKDQSYFLCRLTQNQLAQAVFPLGTWTKAQVKSLATDRELQSVIRQESQDVCFIGDMTYAEFLLRQARCPIRPGDIVDTDGKTVGRHDGLQRYTIGQRRGINVPAAQAYYVVQIDARRNRLVVGRKGDVFARSCTVRDINWIAAVPSEVLAVKVRIRYRHRPVPALVVPVGTDRAVVRFEQPQAAVTPGQGAVFYRGDEVVGGGWIAPESDLTLKDDVQ
jgi:tRNA-specific 2-thiouridylase